MLPKLLDAAPSWRTVTILGFLFLVGAVVSAQDVIVPRQTIHLFNGRDLTNFYTWLVDQKYDDPDKVFSVVEAVDGAPAIRISGQRWGALITKERYANYRLVVEFRWGLLTWGNRKAGVRDSGVLLHAQGRDGNSQLDFNGPWMQSIECQVGEGIVGDFIVVRGYDEAGRLVQPRLTVRVRRKLNGEWWYDLAGEPREVGRVNWIYHDPEWKDKLGYRGKNDFESPYGQWTRLEVVCDENNITNIVNGRVANAGTHSSLSSGKIMLQSEGAEVYYRRIDLEPLKK
jgi:hypothetical protein